MNQISEIKEFKVKSKKYIGDKTKTETIKTSNNQDMDFTCFNIIKFTTINKFLLTLKLFFDELLYVALDDICRSDNLQVAVNVALFNKDKFVALIPAVTKVRRYHARTDILVSSEA